MTRRILGLALAAAAFAALFYVSRFWIFRLWPGDAVLSPQGGQVGRWLQGTGLAPFELLIWAVGAFALLTILQRLYERFDRNDH